MRVFFGMLIYANINNLPKSAPCAKALQTYTLCITAQYWIAGPDEIFTAFLFWFNVL
jgi:hypothetical protein